MYLDCDHLRAGDEIFTVRGNWEAGAKRVFVKPVYRRRAPGQPFAKIVDEPGPTGENMVWVDPAPMTHVPCRGLDPRAFQGDDLWSRMAGALLDLGIAAQDLGVFGSWRLGFETCKDVDFIVYGRANQELLQASMETFKARLGLTNHPLNHARYQAEVHGARYDPACNDLLLCLLNKWSTCGFTDQLTTTLRFVDPEARSGALLEELLAGEEGTERFRFTGVVSRAEGACYLPRTFTVSAGAVRYEVFSPLWIFHQCVKNNDLVTVTGCRRGHRIILRRYDHGLQFV